MRALPCEIQYRLVRAEILRVGRKVLGKTGGDPREAISAASRGRDRKSLLTKLLRAGTSGVMDADGPCTEARRTAACYVENLAALYALDPPLAARVDALPFSQTHPLETARDGAPTVRLIADDNKPVYAHSRYHPGDEARTLVERQGRREKLIDEPQDDEQVPDEELEHACFLVSGFGLGYHVAELERRFPRPLLIVAEDDLALLKAGLCVTDISTPLRERRLLILTTADKAELHERLRPLMTALVLALRLITPPYATRYHREFHTRVRTLMRDFVSYTRLQVYSVIRNARRTCENAAYNLADYAGHPGIELLERRAAGYPAIVVAAGPSLARNVDQLPGLRDKAVIVAVQTVLKTLLARDLRPHFVTTLDFHEISAQFFHGIKDFRDLILVAEAKVAWQVLEAYRGRRHVLHTKFVEELLREHAPQRGELTSGSTVAHLAYYLSVYLGCDPIIFVGQDLSFTDGLYYPAGMQIENIWRPEFGRFQTVEMKQWERIVRARGGLRVVTDVHGRQVYTDDQLYNYAEQFEAEFARSPARIIQASEGGRHLEGTEVMTLREAAERYCTRPLPADLFAVEAGPEAIADKDTVVGALEERLGEVREIRNIAEETVPLLEKLVGLVERPQEFNRLVARVDDLRARMRRNDRTFMLVTQISQLAELRRLQADRGLRDEECETAATARRRLRRDRDYVSACLEGCEYLERMLPAAIRRVQERL